MQYRSCLRTILAGRPVEDRHPFSGEAGACPACGGTDGGEILRETAWATPSHEGTDTYVRCPECGTEFWMPALRAPVPNAA